MKGPADKRPTFMLGSPVCSCWIRGCEYVEVAWMIALGPPLLAGRLGQSQLGQNLLQVWRSLPPVTGEDAQTKGGHVNACRTHRDETTDLHV